MTTARKGLAISLIKTVFEDVLEPCLRKPKSIRLWHKKSNPGDMAEVVTSLDGAIGEFLVKGILAKYPDDEVLCEETGRHNRLAESNENWTWVIDPIDGTTILVDYLYGKREKGGFVIQMALGRNWRPEVGIIFDPTTRQMNVGEIGSGLELWKDGAFQSSIDRTVMERREGTGQRSLSIICSPRNLTALGADQVRESSVCMGLTLLQIAIGKADVFVFPLRSSKIWDSGPALPLLWEADCALVDRRGVEYKTMKEPVNTRGLVACRRDVLSEFFDRYESRINWECDA